jgi:hypothetical protein
MSDRFVFWVVLADGREIRWPGLSAGAARGMYQATRRVSPDAVVRYGYGEM